VFEVCFELKRLTLEVGSRLGFLGGLRESGLVTVDIADVVEELSGFNDNARLVQAGFGENSHLKTLTLFSNMAISAISIPDSVEILDGLQWCA
jgi:hypothetical protein